LAEDNPITSGSDSPGSGAPEDTGPQAAPGAPGATPVESAAQVAPWAGQPPVWRAPAPQAPGWQTPGSQVPGWQSPYAAPTAWRTPSWQPPYAAPGQMPSPAWSGYGYPVAMQPVAWPAVSTPPGPEPGLQWGGILFRFLALLIDGAIIVCSEIALSLFIFAISGGDSSSSSHSTVSMAIGLIWWVFALGYYPVCWYVFGCTLGQRVFSLRVARASDGQALGLGAALIRFIIFATVTVVFPLGIISAIMAWRDPFKRAWHDTVSRSIVVRRGW
jgi:uncharacterized RDD family membrane protein YckC